MTQDRKPNLSIPAAFVLDFKLCVKLIEFTRFADTTSTHAEINEDFSFVFLWFLWSMENTEF